MDKENEGVETVTEEVTPQAPAEGVETKVQDAPAERDYRKELEEEQAKYARIEKERDNYKTATLIAKRKLRDRSAETDEDDDDDNYDEADKADAIADRVLQKIAPTLSQNVVDQEISNYTSNPDKISLIKFHYDNSIAKSGFDAVSIRADVQKAIAIADAPRLRIERDEVARVSVASKTPSLSGSGGETESGVKTHSYGWTKKQVEDINKQQNLVMGRDMTEQELQRAWDIASTGSAGASLPPVR